MLTTGKYHFAPSGRRPVTVLILSARCGNILILNLFDYVQNFPSQYQAQQESIPRPEPIFFKKIFRIV
jgi:hypothetical protein